MGDGATPLIVQIDHESLRQLYSHWLHMVPTGTKAEFQPEYFVAFLPHIFLIDIEDGGRRFRYRLVGTEIERRIGHAITGRYLDEVRQGQTRDNLAELFGTAARRATVGYYKSMLATETEPLATYYRLVMPLAEPDGTVRTLLGGWYCDFAGRQEGTVMAFEEAGAVSRVMRMEFAAPSIRRTAPPRPPHRKRDA